LERRNTDDDDDGNEDGDSDKVLRGCVKEAFVVVVTERSVRRFERAADQLLMAAGRRIKENSMF
jgi:hypothetical protein